MLPRHNDGYVVFLALIVHFLCADIIIFLLRIAIKPTQKQARTHSLLVIGIVAQIKKDVGICLKKLLDDTSDRCPRFYIVRRCLPTAIHQIEPIGWYRREHRFFLEIDGIEDAVVGFKSIFAICVPHLIWRKLGDAIGVEAVHRYSYSA